MAKLDAITRGYLLQRQNRVCFYCLKRIGNLGNAEIDHVVPRAMGGTNDLNNLVASCVPCNRKKNKKNPMQVARENGFLFIGAHAGPVPGANCTFEAPPKAPPGDVEGTAQVLVRVPVSIHQKLKAIALHERTSVNALMNDAARRIIESREVTQEP